MSEEVKAWGTRSRISDNMPSAKVHAVLGTGAADIAAARQAVASASGSFKVDPELVDRMIKKLAEMQDHLDKMVRRSNELTADTKLGDGYARVISTNNSQFGELAGQQVRSIVTEIDGLKTQLEKSRASYQNVDQARADSLKKLNGKS